MAQEGELFWRSTNWPYAQTRRRHATLQDRKRACSRIATHWDEDAIAQAELYIMQFPWNARHTNENDLVQEVTDDILTGHRDLEDLVELIIAVMAWTGGVLPDAWHWALSHLDGPTELHLRAFFNDFDTPHRSPV
jgi:hypothetical protein